MRRGPLRAEILQIAAQLFLRGDRDALLEGGDEPAESEDVNEE